MKREDDLGVTTKIGGIFKDNQVLERSLKKYKNSEK